jgi:hypothetical protein
MAHIPINTKSKPRLKRINYNMVSDLLYYWKKGGEERGCQILRINQSSKASKNKYRKYYFISENILENHT